MDFISSCKTFEFESIENENEIIEIHISTICLTIIANEQNILNHLFWLCKSKAIVWVLRFGIIVVTLVNWRPFSPRQCNNTAHFQASVSDVWRRRVKCKQRIEYANRSINLEKQFLFITNSTRAPIDRRFQFRYGYLWTILGIDVTWAYVLYAMMFHKLQAIDSIWKWNQSARTGEGSAAYNSP